jgi:hypothetical protein
MVTIMAMADTIRVGQPFQLQVRVSYTGSKPTVLLADTALQPFELISHQVTPLAGRGDSLVLQLRTWSVEPVQTFSLPYTWLASGGKQQGRSQLKLYLAQSLNPGEAAQLDYRKDLRRMDAPAQSNRLLWAGLAMVLFLVLLGMLWLLFGNRIRAWRAQRKLMRQCQKTLQLLAELGSSLLAQDQRSYVLAANALWKTALQPLVDPPLHSRTNQELLAWLPNMRPPVQESAVAIFLLQAENRIVYAGEAVPTHDLQRLHSQLVAFVQAIYMRRKEGIRP